jgi:hypothetical protein
MREAELDEAMVDASGEALAALFSWEAGCLCEHPASNTAASNATRIANPTLNLRFNVPEPPVGVFP